MPAVVVSRAINASAERVWEVVTDLAKSPDVLSQVMDVEVMTEGDFSIGTRWRETRRMFGSEATAEMEVAALDPGRWYDVVAEDDSATYRSRIELSEQDEATVITMTFSAEGSGRMGRVLGALTGPMFRSATKKALDTDLADIAAVAEPSRAAGD